jgi:hypothetical protein
MELIFSKKLNENARKALATSKMRPGLSDGIFEEIYDYTTISLAPYSDPLDPFITPLLQGLGSHCKEIYGEG